MTRRPATAAGYIRLINAHIEPAFGKDAPAAITRNRVELWHGRIAEATPINAATARSGVLSAFLSWLEHDHKIERNPCRGVRKAPESQR